MGGANAQDPQGWKRPWGPGVWGLGSRNRRGPGVPPTPGLRGQGTSPGSPAGFLGSSGRGNPPPLLSRSAPPGGPLPPADLPSLGDANPVWPPLLLPAQSLYILPLPVHCGVSPISLGVSPPTAASRCPSCGETLIPRLPAPPS